MKKSTSRKWQTAIAIFLVIVGILYFSPLYILFINSFKSFGEILSAPASLPKSISFNNYVTVWKRIALANSFKNSMGHPPFEHRYFIILEQPNFHKRLDEKTPDDS